MALPVTPSGSLDERIANGLEQAWSVGGMSEVNGKLPDIGEQLRAARVSQGLALDALADELCICSRQLEALEDNRYDALPEQVYVVGFLRTYAAHLGLDVDRLSDQYKALHGVDSLTTELHFPEPIRETKIPTLSLMAGGVGALVLVYAGWASLSGGDLRQASLVPAPPESLVAMVGGDKPLSTESVTASAAKKAQALTVPPGIIPVMDEPAKNDDAFELQAENVRIAGLEETVAEKETDSGIGSALIGSANASETGLYAPASALTGASRVQILARADTWIMITDSDGQLLMEGVIRLGERYTPPSVAGLKLSTSNAAGLEVTVDGKLVKDLGDWGTVVNAVPLDAGALSNLHFN